VPTPESLNPGFKFIADSSIVPSLRVFCLSCSYKFIWEMHGSQAIEGGDCLAAGAAQLYGEGIQNAHSCSPQPTIVDLLPAAYDGQSYGDQSVLGADSGLLQEWHPWDSCLSLRRPSVFRDKGMPLMKDTFETG